MINLPEWGCGNGWEFPVKPDVVMGGCFSEPLLVVIFAQVLTRKQTDACRTAIEEMTDEEKCFLNKRAREVRCLYVWGRARLPMAELVLDV